MSDVLPSNPEQAAAPGVRHRTWRLEPETERPGSDLGTPEATTAAGQTVRQTAEVAAAAQT